jgi:putative Holliday junction resolvase
MYVLGIDFGTKKLGLAILETTSELASPLPIIKNDIDLFKKLASIIKSYRITTVVLGFPSYEDTQAKVTKFVEELAKQVGPLTVFLENEDNTSIGIKSQLDTKKKKSQLDSYSAVEILNQWQSKKLA